MWFKLLEDRKGTTLVPIILKCVEEAITIVINELVGTIGFRIMYSRIGRSTMVRNSSIGTLYSVHKQYSALGSRQEPI